MAESGAALAEAPPAAAGAQRARDLALRLRHVHAGSVRAARARSRANQRAFGAARDVAQTDARRGGARRTDRGRTRTVARPQVLSRRRREEIARRLDTRERRGRHLSTQALPTGAPTSLPRD